MRSIAFDYLSCRCLLLFSITNIKFIYYMIFRKIWKTSKEMKSLFMNHQFHWFFSHDFSSSNFRHWMREMKIISFSIFISILSTSSYSGFYLFFFLQLRNIHILLTHMFILLPHAWTYLAQKIYDSRECFWNSLRNFVFLCTFIISNFMVMSAFKLTFNKIMLGLATKTL